MFYSGIYNDGNANSLQYIFEWDPTKKTTKYYPDVGISGQKIDDAQYQQQDSLLIGTDIAFVVKK